MKDSGLLTAKECPKCGEQGFEDGGQIKFLCGSLLRFFPEPYLDRTSTCHRISELETEIRKLRDELHDLQRKSY